MEVYLDLGFMVFGLGFFVFIINMVRKDDNVAYDRKLSEAREFGFENSKLQKEALRHPKK